MQNLFSIQVFRMIKPSWLSFDKIPLCMRLCVLFLACSLSLTHAAETYAQKTQISIDANNQTVESVLQQIKAKTGFDFFFNNKHVDLNRRVSVSARQGNVFEVLGKVFAGTNVTYSVLDKKIILSNEGVKAVDFHGEDKR